MFASEDEENREKILRSVKRAFAEVQTELGEYLNENGTTTDNSHYDGSTDLVLNLTMPSNFNEAATTGVRRSSTRLSRQYGYRRLVHRHQQG